MMTRCQDIACGKKRAYSVDNRRRVLSEQHNPKRILGMLKKDTWEAYREDGGLNCSTLQNWINEKKGNPPKGFKGHFIFGRALHELCLEPHIALEKTQHYALILTKKERAILKGMKNSFYKNPNTKAMISNPANNREISCYSRYRGIGLKSRFDLHNAAGIVCDLKGFTEINRMKWCFDSFLFDVQCGFYAFNYENSQGLPLKVFVFLMIDKIHPHHIAIVEIKGEKLKEFKEKAQGYANEYIKERFGNTLKVVR